MEQTPKGLNPGNAPASPRAPLALEVGEEDAPRRDRVAEARERIRARLERRLDERKIYLSQQWNNVLMTLVDAIVDDDDDEKPGEGDARGADVSPGA